MSPYSRRPRLLLLALALAAPSLAGCGYLALAGVGAFALSGGGKKGSLPPATPVSISTPATIAFDRVPLSYVLTGPGGSRYDVRVEYSTQGTSGPFHAASEAIGAPSQGTSQLTASPQGNPHLFVWLSFADLAPQQIVHSDRVVVRVTALQAGTAAVTSGAATAYGLPAETQAFTLDNRLIATVAGPPTTGGEDVPATEAPLLAPDTAILGPGGDLFVSDTGSVRVRREDATTHLVVTLAGSGVAGFGGDGGPAPAAQLLRPRGIASDGLGGILLADSANARLRRVDLATGFISTIAGTGSAAYSGTEGRRRSPG